MNREGADGQYVHEEIRRNLRQNLRPVLKANGAVALARHVDEQPLINAQLRMYSEYTSNLKRTIKSESDDDVQKARGRYGSGYGVGEFSLTEPLEKVFYDHYGVGFDGSPYPTRIGAGWTCPKCGLRMVSSPKMWPERCPICGMMTPLGMVIRDGIYKR